MTVDDRMFSDAESRRGEWNRLKPFFDEIMSNDEENIIILNYSCTSETASANGCVLSDINITDNLHSFPPKKGILLPWVIVFLLTGFL